MYQATCAELRRHIGETFPRAVPHQDPNSGNEIGFLLGLLDKIEATDSLGGQASLEASIWLGMVLEPLLMRYGLITYKQMNALVKQDRQRGNALCDLSVEKAILPTA